MQDFFLKHFKSNIRNTLVNNQLKILDRCIKQKVPMIILEYKDKGETISVLKNKLKHASHSIVFKANNSGFTNTDLDGVLKKMKISKLLVLGINANGCIQDTT